MNNLFFLFPVFLISFFMSKWGRKIAVARNILDIPNPRSSHDIPTPRGGGVAILIAFLFGVFWLYIRGEMPGQLFVVLCLGSSLVSGIGLWDDMNHVPPWGRLIVHFFAAGIAGYYIIACYQSPRYAGFGQYSLIIWIILVITTVWCLNLFNFMDGIDGLAASETISVAWGAAMIIFMQHGAILEFVLLLLLGVSCSGFLFWNWPPARIFMGDVGSGFLGYVLAVFALLTSASGKLSLWGWVILFGCFLVDATITLIRRVVRGENFMKAHRSHAYQILSRRFDSHKKVTTGVILINIFWLLPLAALTVFFRDKAIIIFSVALLPIVYATIRLGAGTTND